MQQQRLAFFDEDYLSRSWKMLTRVPGWIKPLLLLTLVSFIPIFGLIFVLGYTLEWARLTAWGIDSSPKQSGVDVGACLSCGWRGLLVMLCWTIPWGFVSSALRQMLPMVPLLDLIFSVLTVFVGVIATAAALRATIYQRFSAGVGFDVIFQMLGADYQGLLRIAGISIFGSLVTSVVGGIIMTVGSVGVVPSIVSLAESMPDMSLEDPVAMGKLFGTLFSALGPAIAIALVVCGLISVMFNLLSTNAVGLWMLQFDVPSWGDKDAPLPPRIPAAPRVWAAPDHPVVPADPLLPTSTIQPTPQQPAEQSTPPEDGSAR